jgi:hypothetical protein
LDFLPHSGSKSKKTVPFPRIEVLLLQKNQSVLFYGRRKYKTISLPNYTNVDAKLAVAVVVAVVVVAVVVVAVVVVVVVVVGYICDVVTSAVEVDCVAIAIFD